MAAQFVTLVNQKGGVGKTTTAVSLAVALGRRGQKVLLIDLDPQANATSALGLDGVERRGIYDALLDDVPIEDCIVQVPEERIDTSHRVRSFPALRWSWCRRWRANAA